MKSIIKQLPATEIIEFVFRIYVFTFLNVYALGKLMGGQFYTPTSIPEDVFSTPLGLASNFDLGWTFMGRSYGYILFIGVSQLIGSWLLLFNRSKLLGVAILIPILVNIIVFDIFFLDKWGALASASIYFSMLLGILWFNKENVVQAFLALIPDVSSQVANWKRIVIKLGLSLLICGLIFIIDQWIVNLLGHGNG